MASPRAFDVRVSRESDATRAILDAQKLARAIGFNPTVTAKIATAVSELARNILRYAERGTVRARSIRAGGRDGIEIVVSDTGPGIADLEDALREHVSTGGGLGLGLPGVKRLMDTFQIESTQGDGTTVTIRKWL